MEAGEDNDALWIPVAGSGQELAALAVKCNNEVNSTATSVQQMCLHVASQLCRKPVSIQR